VCAILTIFFLSWGPRMGAAALRQIQTPERQRLVGRLTRRAFTQGRGYVLWSIGLALAVGVVAGGLCRLENVPAPMALAVLVAAGSVIPGVGVIVGALPAVLLEAGLGSPMEGARLFLAFLVVQALHHLVLRRVVAPRTLRPGPAVIVIALVLGYEVYGAGGAFYGAALMVFLIAALEAAGAAQEAARA
jgi:predicted PurR-regulated permease PerM